MFSVSEKAALYACLARLRRTMVTKRNIASFCEPSSSAKSPNSFTARLRIGVRISDIRKLMGKPYLRLTRVLDKTVSYPGGRSRPCANQLRLLILLRVRQYIEVRACLLRCARKLMCSSCAHHPDSAGFSIPLEI